MIQVAAQVFFLSLAEPASQEPHLRKKAAIRPDCSGHAPPFAPIVTPLQLENRWLPGDE
jgi:hypothetical protein